MEDKVTIVMQYHGLKRMHEIPKRYMKTFRVDDITFGISIVQSYYYDSKQDKWRFTKKLYRPGLFVLDVWGQYSYFAPLDMWIPCDGWEFLTTERGTDILEKIIREGEFGGKPILEFLADHELTGKGGFL